MMRSQSPFTTLLIGLVLAMFLEALIMGSIRDVLLQSPFAVRWLVTLAVVGAAVWYAAKTGWLMGMSRMKLTELVLATLLVLLGMTLLENRIDEVPVAVGALVAGLAGVGVALAMWRMPTPLSMRRWIAPAFGVVMFATLFW